MLGNLTFEGFLGLPQPDQKRNLFRSQVTEEDVIIKQADEARKWFNQEIKNHSILRDAELVAPGEAGQETAQKASQIHYANSTFRVDSYYMGSFSVTASPIMLVVKYGASLWMSRLTYWTTTTLISARMTLWRVPRMGSITLNRRTSTATTGRRGRQLPPAVRDLRQLSQLTKAEMIYVYIIGGGASDGSDLRAQLKIRQICRVVKRLLNLFGERLKVWKVLKFNDLEVQGTGPPAARDITDYWTAPTVDVKARVVESQATFRDIMQVQIAAWAWPVSQLVGPHAYSINLL